MGKRDLKELEAISEIMDIAEKQRDASKKYSQLSWTQYTVGFDFGLKEAMKNITDILENKSNFETICKYREKDLSPLNKRRVELIYKSFEPYHKSKEINNLNEKIRDLTRKLSMTLNQHRSILDGKQISSPEIANILSTNLDENIRKKAYLARAQINKPLFDGGFLELVNMRNEYAKLNGFNNFVEYSLDGSELSRNIFSNWRKEIKTALPKMKKLRKDFAKKYLQKDNLQPWDSAFITSEIAPQMNASVKMSNFFEPIKKLYNKFGFDISNQNTTYDIFPRKNKSEWGYNFTIELGKDSRILANVKDKYYEFGVLMHETGHATHFSNIDPDDILLNSGISGIVSEGIANLFGNFIYDEIFYTEFFKGKIEEAKIAFGNLEKWRKINSLRAIPTILFDQELYLNKLESLDDIHQLLWKIDKETLDEPQYADEPVWGFRIHHTTHPIYLHNYFMGDVTCEMLKKVFTQKQKINSILEMPKEFGAFLLNDVIQVSGELKYEELFKKISGNEFSLKYITE